MKRILTRIPVVSIFVKRALKKVFGKPFPGSENYWIQRYEYGGNSGPGSYNQLAKFKAEILNDFVTKNQISTVIEYGCGDGNQLKFANYPSYLGFDVSSKAIALCKELFEDDQSKEFKLMDEYEEESAYLTLSLDVIYHLVEDDVYLAYMRRLFSSSKRFVIIYSSNRAENLNGEMPHIRHRQFTRWIETHQPNWQLLQRIPNRFPFTGNVNEGSHADFFIYKRKE